MSKDYAEAIRWLEAYKWLALSIEGLDGKDRDASIAALKETAKRLKSAQLTDAQRRMRLWVDGFKLAGALSRLF